MLNKKELACWTKDYIDKNYSKKVTLRNLAKKHYCSTTLLNNYFKSEYGTTVYGYLIEKRFNEAKEYILDGYTVKEAAKLVGFGDVSRFPSKYKKHFGVYPKEDKRKVKMIAYGERNYL